MEYANQRNHTRHVIKISFINLLQFTRFENVSIGLIAKEAGISRSSFYRYYFDKYELVYEIEDNLLKSIDEFKKSRQGFTYKNIDTIDENYIEELLIFLQKYRKELNGLLNNANNISLESKLKDMLTRKLSEVTKLSISSIKIDTKKRQEYKLMVDYMSNMIIQTFKFWSSPDCNITAAELSNLLNHIKLHGFSDIRKLLK
ncbi:TetR/AcrR family transcriptional regulator [Leuconostoc mesenteroides]|nr:TetR/AcrR family transcriptional regulator [Leuconostoc mesenteroides]